MSTQTTKVCLTILDKEYQIACPMGEEEALMQAAKLLDEQMRTIRGRGRIIGIERIAVMAALHIAYTATQPTEIDSKLTQRINTLQTKIEDALAHTHGHPWVEMA